MSVDILRLLIVDDEAIARGRLRGLCVQVEGVEVVGECASGSDALSAIEALSPDLVLLDISMPGLDGMAMAAALEPMPSAPAIVFCTAYDQHALAAFDVSAVDYLLKPVGRERLVIAIDKVRRARERRNDQPTAAPWQSEFWIPHRGAMVRIEADRIDRIDAEGDYVHLKVSGASYLLHQTLTGIAAGLDPVHFIRLRRSVIVRRSLISKIRHSGEGVWTASLVDGDTVRVGPTYLAALKASFVS